ncbi:hypothetical protein CDAR_387571 [Caerostris darwini]|uniref:Uncharacterized protein n=1 Tax=Caerostris darwini TaxID=1538125 RepID=A0AAV4TLJ6_9ARAC|nr:hypothetical protein CDAR_387571 [Caerostris darwini]
MRISEKEKLKTHPKYSNASIRNFSTFLKVPYKGRGWNILGEILPFQRWKKKEKIQKQCFSGNKCAAVAMSAGHSEAFGTLSCQKFFYLKMYVVFEETHFKSSCLICIS